MMKRGKVLLAVVLVLVCLSAVKLAGMRYCSSACSGTCGCEGTVTPDGPCCFHCTYYGLRIDCCQPTNPGGADGCTVWEQH